jgi:hypothetical protein
VATQIFLEPEMEISFLIGQKWTKNGENYGK